MGEVGAVQRDRPRARRAPRAPARPSGRSGRGRCRSARRRARRRSARRRDVGAGAARARTRTRSISTVAGAPQRLHLIARRSCRSAGSLGRRVHVGDDQRAHRSRVPRAYPPDRTRGQCAPVPLWHHGGHVCARRASGGRVRLRRRRPDRPARAARLAADRGLPVPRRHRALPVRRSQRSEELRAFAIEIAEHLLDAGAKLLVVACNAASSAALGALEAPSRARAAATST